MNRRTKGAPSAGVATAFSDLARPKRSHSGFALAAATGAAVVLASGDASAQYWLQDRALTQGSGIRVGNVELHPGIGAEAGYDSNTTYATFGQPTNPSIRLRFTPSIALQTLGAQRSGPAAQQDRGASAPVVNFSLLAAVIPVVYIPLTTPDVVSRATNVGGNLSLNLHVLPQRPWQFILREEFSRAIQGALDAGVSLYTFNRIENSATAEIAYQSPGEVLEWRLGYNNRISIMTDGTVGQDRFNRMDNEVSTRLRWRFFPKTSLLFDAAITPTFYLSSGSAALGLFTGFPVRTRVGLNGLLSERLALQFFAGYAGSYIAQGDNVDTFIGQAELKYMFGPLTSFRFGVLRDVNISLLGGFYIRNMAYLGINQSFGGRFYLSADVSGGLYEFGYVANASGAPAGSVTGSGFWFDAMTNRFNSVRVDGRLFGEVRATNWLGFNLTTAVSTNITDATYTSVSAISLSWVRFEAFLGVRANW